jgi:hypothetical protein
MFRAARAEDVLLYCSPVLGNVLGIEQSGVVEFAAKQVEIMELRNQREMVVLRYFRTRRTQLELVWGLLD